MVAKLRFAKVAVDNSTALQSTLSILKKCTATLNTLRRRRACGAFLECQLIASGPKCRMTVSQQLFFATMLLLFFASANGLRQHQQQQTRRVRKEIEGILFLGEPTPNRQCSDNAKSPLPVTSVREGPRHPYLLEPTPLSTS